MSLNEVAADFESGSELVKLTAFLTPRAYQALESAAEATGDTRTDSLNRAVTLYDLLVRTALQGEGAVVSFEVSPGMEASVVIAPSA